MKKDIHPEYKEVVFLDTSSDFKFLTKSTMTSKDTIKWEDGNEYPLIKVEVSSASHPFYTGKKLFVDTAGRVEKFNKKYKLFVDLYDIIIADGVVDEKENQSLEKLKDIIEASLQMSS